MGSKLLRRLKGNKKADKWQKGHSCVSNPTISKHRDKAKQGFFQKISNSELTLDAVAQHTQQTNSLSSTYSAASVRSAISGCSRQLSNAITKLSEPTPSVRSLQIDFNAPQDGDQTRPRTTMDLQRDMEMMAIDKDDDLKSQAKTFASRYTTCSLPAFEHFFSTMSVESEHQKRMLAFHGTVQEMINKKQLPEIPASYFVAIIVSVQSVMDSPDDVCAGLALLVRVIKTVPIHTLRARCSYFGNVLDTVIKTYQDSDNVQLLTHALGCLSILLRAQHLASWYNDDDQLKTWLKNILVFTMHSHPKVRRSGQYNVSAVLKGSSFMITSPLRVDKENEDDDDEDNDEADVSKNKPQVNGDSKSSEADAKGLEIHPAAELVADFLIGQLKSSGNLKAANKFTIHMLVFTRQVIMAMPKHKLQVVMRCLFGLVDLGNGLVNSTVLQSLQTLCDAHPPVAVLPHSLTLTLLNTLTKHSPGMSSALIAAPHDYQAVQAWTGVATAALQHNIRLDCASGLDWAGKWCTVALQYWKADDTRVLQEMESSVSSVLRSSFDAITLLNSQQHTEAIRAIVVQLEAALSYQYQCAWPCIFRLLGQCYNEFGLYYSPVLMPSVKTLCQLMDNTNLLSAGELEKALGKVVQGLGVETLAYSAPIKMTGDIVVDEKNLWVLPLLRKFLKGSRLVFFKDYYVPLAQKCFEIIHKLKNDENSDPRLIQTYSTIEYQIWALLPSFADDAVDVELSQSDKSFAKLICRLIADFDKCRIDAMRALRNMIVADGTSTGRLAKNANNYLPALFNVFVREPLNSKNMNKPNVVDGSHRKAAFETIRVYLPIVPKLIKENFMTSIIELYTKTEEPHRKNSLLNLARLFIPHVSADKVHSLILMIEPLIKSAKDRRDQKAAYKLLQDILSCESEVAQEFINKHLSELSLLLLQGTSKAAASSRAPRLRCAKVVLSKLSDSSEDDTREEFLQSVVAEAVLCIGRTHSTAARFASNELLQVLSGAMRRIHNNDTDTVIRECMRLLSGGLLGRPALCANTVYAITVFTYHNKDMPLDIVEQNVTNMCTLLACASREVVQACLSFLKGIVSLYPTLLIGPLVKTILLGITSMVADCSRKYRVKTDSIMNRLIEKFGTDHISSLIPPHHEVLHKRLRNLRKKKSRAKRDKEARERDDEGNEDLGAEELYTEKAPTSLEEILEAIDPDLVGADKDEVKKNMSSDSHRRRKQPTTAWLEEEDSDDDIIDLLGPAAAQAVRAKKPYVKKTLKDLKSKGENEEDGFRVDPVSGKLLIVEDKKAEKEEKINHVTMNDMDDMMHLRTGALSGKITKRKRDSDDDLEEDTPESTSAKRPKQKNKFDYGAEYRSKKGFGDSMKKGQTQKPFAYVPFNKDRLNKRKRAKYEGQFKAVVRGTKRGIKQAGQQRNKKRS